MCEKLISDETYKKKYTVKLRSSNKLQGSYVNHLTSFFLASTSSGMSTLSPSLNAVSSSTTAETTTASVNFVTSNKSTERKFKQNKNKI